MFQIELVERCKANDRSAQMQLYQQYSQGMYGVAMRFLGNTTDAEDMVQEAFIKAFQKIGQYKGEVTFGAWLKRIVVNKCIDFLKSKKEHLLQLDETYMHIEEESDWTVEDGIGLETVKKAIDGLPDKYRYVVQLFLVEGYDHAEISQILDMPEATCRVRLMRGKGQLQESLKLMRHGTGY